MGGKDNESRTFKNFLEMNIFKLWNRSLSFSIWDFKSRALLPVLSSSIIYCNYLLNFQKHSGKTRETRNDKVKKWRYLPTIVIESNEETVFLLYVRNKCRGTKLRSIFPASATKRNIEQGSLSSRQRSSSVLIRFVLFNPSETILDTFHAST